MDFTVDFQSMRKNKDKVYKFHDAGSVYHDTNFTCPVKWEWTYDPNESDAIWYNVLEHYYMLNMLPEMKAAMDKQMKDKSLGTKPLNVFMSLESELYYPNFVDAKKVGFDFIVDYRIWNNTPGGMADIPAVYLLNPTDPNSYIDFRKPFKLSRRKDALVAAFISNCQAKNDREAYMAKLMEAIPFHSYGACHQNIEEPQKAKLSKAESKAALAQQYYFVFAPENSDRHSYVTEKVYSILASGSVPIYYGADNIDRFIPHPSAIIKARDFESPEALAKYLIKVASNEKEYAKFFEWKKKPFTPDFSRVLRLASRTVQCRLAMRLEGLDFELDVLNHTFYPIVSS
eukprot:jgi/Picsp_1/6737/NSC_04078-R1_alpha fucosyltransferase